MILRIGFREMTDSCKGGGAPLLNASGSGSHASLLQKQMSFKTAVGGNPMSKADEIEVLESGHVERPTTGYTKVNAILVLKRFLFYLSLFIELFIID